MVISFINKYTQEINDDPVRKFQINYNNDLYMVPKYPEGMTLDGVQLPENIQHFEQPLVEVNGNQVHTIAPGEGKVPIDIVYCKDWDAKAFPMLFPDGKNTLFDDNREKKIRDQDFFCQRLFNVDPRGETIFIGYLRPQAIGRKRISKETLTWHSKEERSILHLKVL